MATQIQTLVFDKRKFKKRMNAVLWAKKRKFKVSKVDEKTKTFRIRQVDPNKFIKTRFRTIKLDNGVNAVIGIRKRK